MRRDAKLLNAKGWDERAANGDAWTRPVDDDTIARARRGDWSVVLTPLAPVPRAWFGELAGARVLCLASGGGQQAPVLAAAGASVTVLDRAGHRARLGRMRAGVAPRRPAARRLRSL